jgi:sigma-B regulation protein RsbU (phosphoserine phosphatase)
LQGPEVGRKYTLDGPTTLLGRQFDCTICLNGKQVSRQHAQLLQRESSYFVEDLNSSNGTYVNGKKIAPHVPVPLSDRDTLQIGPYLFALRPKSSSAKEDATAAIEPPIVVREQVSAVGLSQSVYKQDPATKLQTVLEIAQLLAGTIDIEPLLDKLLEHLMRLFPQADRAIALLCEGDKLIVRGQRSRGTQDATTIPYSRTIVRKALDDGVGLLSEDAHSDQRFSSSSTLTGLDLRSILCVPLIGADGKRLGAIQVDRFRRGLPFRVEDLHLLTTLCLQVVMVLELAALHAERIKEQRLQQELAFAREIQQGFLPQELEGFHNPDFEVFGKVFPARQVAGDLYDFLQIPGGRLAFFVGDVSGKGMPAALFMVAVRTLCRHLAQATLSPTATLGELNTALSADNPSGMFVTLAHGTFDPATGNVVLASGGHPPPLLRHTDGRVEEVPLTTGRLLGFEEGSLFLTDLQLTLAPGQTLVFYTDGVTEAREPGDKAMFGVERFRKVVTSFDLSMPLEACAEKTSAAIADYTKAKELQDDVTVLLLRRRPKLASRAP